MNNQYRLVVIPILVIGLFTMGGSHAFATEIGKEVSVRNHLQDGDEFNMKVRKLIGHGKLLFGANWTNQEDGGRPFTKGTGSPLTDSSSPLVFPRNFNRISAPDTNSCSGCHNKPRIGGGGEIVTNAFITGQRFDFATFDHNDTTSTRGALAGR
jgi:hypothetical protein